ncbi:MAG: alpha/beta hydrolase [Gammaproteobacteria bacterium]
MKRSLVVRFLLSISFATVAWADGLEPTGFITYSGLDLAVYESEGTEGPGVLLVHGNTSSAHSYARVLGSAFGERVRVAAVDLPGFGRSDNADAASYNAAFLAGAIVATAEALNLVAGVFVGWSLGGDLLLQASSQLDAKGYFLFGTAPLPVGDAPDPPPFLTPLESYAGDAVNFGFVADLTTEQIAQYVTAFFRPGFQSIPNFFFVDGERTDPNTRTAVAAAVFGLDDNFQDEVDIVTGLTGLKVPVALLLGERDAFVRPEY